MGEDLTNCVEALSTLSNSMLKNSTSHCSEALKMLETLGPLLFLQNKLAHLPQMPYPVTSRIHALRSFSPSSATRCYIKRDDELGWGISGNKFRKYRMLIPQLLAQGYREVVVIGGPFSNHVLAICQLLLENGLTPTLFLRGLPPQKKIGNYLMLHMLLPETAFHFVPKAQWAQLDAHIAAYVAEKTGVGILPEGGALFSAFTGALTLPLDILNNEQEAGQAFDHIFLDVGTGYCAAACLLGWAFIHKRTTCHLAILGGTTADFYQQLHQLHAAFEIWLGVKCPFPDNFHCYPSELAPAFGSTNRQLFHFVIQTARNEGVFLDPIYSGKLFFLAKQLMQDPGRLTGNVLVVHSGGALTLAGFQEQLNTSLNSLYLN